MEDEVTKITFFRSFSDAAQFLSDEDRLSFYDGLFAYAFDGIEPDFDGALALAFTLVKPNLDSSISKRAAGKSGGRPSKKDVKSMVKTNLKTTPKTTCESNKDKEKDKEKDKDKDRDKEGKVCFPLEENKHFPAPDDGAGDGNAAPPTAAVGEVPSPYVLPYCSECGLPSPPTIGGFKCPKHGIRGSDGVVFL